jgi:hypothetical protein
MGTEAQNPDKYHHFCRTAIIDLFVVHEVHSSVNFVVINNGKGFLQVHAGKGGLIYRFWQSYLIYLMNADKVMFS